MAALTSSPGSKPVRNNNPPAPNDSQPVANGSQPASSHSKPAAHDSKPAAHDSKPVRKRAPYYPTGDGKPMAEDTLHRKLMAYCCEALEFHFAARPDFYVAGNDFVYYEEGNPQARVSPDCYVVIGVPKRLRPFYKVWEEGGIAPSVIFEFTSRKTRKDDVTFKKPLYEQVLRVQEYFQFDPTGDYLSPRLQGQRLREGRYEGIELRDNRMWSEQLALELVVVGEDLRFYDAARGEWLRTYAEAETQRLAEAQRAQREAQRADSEVQRADSERERANSEAQRAEAEKQNAEAEARRAEAAEAELARLRAELEVLRREK